MHPTVCTYLQPIKHTVDSHLPSKVKSFTDAKGYAIHIQSNHSQKP